MPAAAAAATSYPQSDGSDGACTFSQSGTLDLNTNTYTAQGGGSFQIGNHGVLNCTTLAIPSGVTFTISGQGGTLDLRATGDVNIAGTIDVAGASGGTPQGGNTANAGTAGGGGGGSAGQAGENGNPGGGAGGSFGGGSGGTNGGGGGGGGYSGGGGGSGAGSTSTGGAGGGPGGLGASGESSGGGPGGGGSAPSATPGSSGATGLGGGGGGGGGFGNVAGLHPGSGGGGDGSSSGGSPSAGGGGGGGGGAVRVVTPGTLTVSGNIVAGGGDGGEPSMPIGNALRGGSGGGGSGGDIYLAAPTVSLPGIVSASGGIGGPAVSQGGGAGGNGSAGRIQIFANILSGYTSSNPTATTSAYSYTLAAAKSGTGGGTISSSPSGISCGSDCDESYDPGATVTLSASPNSQSQFTGWSGGSCSGTGDCPVTLNADTTVTAMFADVTPPNTTITAGPSGPTRDPTPTFGFKSSEAGSSFQCRVDSATFAACASPKTTAALADGSHAFRVRAKDAAGNVDQTPALRTFMVDTHRPSSQASSPVSTHNSPFAVHYTVSDPSPSSGIASVELWAHHPGQTGYSKVATDLTPATPSFPYKPNAGAGKYSFYTRAKDRAGNYEPPPSSPDAATLYSP